MKHFVSIFGPAMRALNKNIDLRRRLTVGAFVVLLGLAMLNAVPTVLHRAEGWEKTTAVVVKAGVTSHGHKHPSETTSVVRFSAHGQELFRSFALNWELREGDTTPVWTRAAWTRKVIDHTPIWTPSIEATHSNPARTAKLMGRPMLWALFALIATVILAMLVTGMRSMVFNYDFKVIRKEDEAKEAERFKELKRLERDSVERIVALALSNSDAVVHLTPSAASGVGVSDMDWLRGRLFVGKDRVSVREVLQALEDEHGPTYLLGHLLMGALIELKVLDRKSDIADGGQWSAAVKKLLTTSS